MSRRRKADPSNQDEPPIEPDEVGVALQSVSYDLTHDPSDTGANLRDAAELAPLAFIKLAQRYVGALSRPKNVAALVAGGAVALLVAGIVLVRRKRS